MKRSTSKVNNNLLRDVVICIIIFTALISLATFLLHNTESRSFEETKEDPVPQANTAPIETTPVSTISNPVTSAIFSAWLWDSPDSFSKEDLVKIFEISKKENISTIYLRMDDYADIYEMKNSTEKVRRIEALDTAAENFIVLASKYGIKVEALGGNTTWAEPENLFYPNLFFDGVIKYNASHPHAQFVGIQFDVESNNSPSYKLNKQKALLEYLDFVEDMIDKKPKSDFLIGFAIPFFYSVEGNSEGKIDWNGRGSKLVAYHMFDLLNETEGGYVAYMNYRNLAEGVYGSINKAQDIFNYVSKNNHQVKIVIGQETDNVSPARITFHGKSKTYFKTEVAKLISAFLQYPQFAGIAIHHLQSYIDL